MGPPYAAEMRQMMYMTDATRDLASDQSSAEVTDKVKEKFLL